jgi:phage major head subunit gpT-like protein
MQMNIANQSNLDAARIGFHAAFLEQLGLVTALPLEQALLHVSSNTSLEEWEWLGDVPGFTEWTEDRMLEVLKAYKLRIANKDWASGLRLHQNQFKDDRMGMFPASVANLALAARQHRADFAAKVLINGFDGTAYPEVGNGLAYDGKFMFDATHATGSNVLNQALTGAGLDAAELLMGSQTTYDGKRKLRIRGTHLVHGPKLRSQAELLMKADYLPSAAGTATQSNVYKGRYELIEEPWLAPGSAFDDWWFLLDLSKPWKPIVFQMREEISTSAILGNQGGSGDSMPRFQRGEVWFGAEARYNLAPFEYRLAVGSNPA